MFSEIFALPDIVFVRRYVWKGEGDFPAGNIYRFPERENSEARDLVFNGKEEKAKLTRTTVC